MPEPASHSTPDLSQPQPNDRLTAEEAEACRRFHWNPVGYLKRKQEAVFYQTETGPHIRFTVPERPGPLYPWEEPTEDAVTLGLLAAITAALEEQFGMLLRQLEASRNIKSKPLLEHLRDQNAKRYRSIYKRHIRSCLNDDTQASNEQVCRYLEEQGIGKFPKSWAVTDGQVLHAYQNNEKARRNIASSITKVRHDLGLT